MRYVTLLITAALLVSACSDGDLVLNEQYRELTPERVLIRLHTDQPVKLAHHLGQDGHDLVSSNIRKGYVDVIVGLAERGNISTHYKALIKEEQFLESSKTPKALSDYYNPAEVDAFLDVVEANYPAIAQKVLLQGGLYEGQTIWAMKISDNVAVDEDEPTYQMDGQTHANEVMTAEVMVDAIDYLTSNYDSDAQVKRWVDEMEIWIVPVVNPDGAAHMFSGASWWRKNRNPECGSDIGVDLNRNFEWNYRACSGSSDSCSDSTYHGTGAASELETQAIQALMEQVRPMYYINYHSSGEMILWPTSCGRNEEYDLLEHVGETLNNMVETDDGTTGNWTTGVAPEVLYSAPGGADDHAYGAVGAVSFCIELNSSSQQPDHAIWRDITVQRQRAAWGHLLDRTLDAPAITGHTYDAGTLAPVVADYQYASSPFESGQWQLKTDTAGRFGRAVLPNSEHTLVFSATGYLPESRQVQVTTTPVDLDVPMTAGTNHAPTADAGPDQVVDELANVELDGSGSSDP
ncbi:MAG: hypothetical protein JRJ19_04565, partial [Deltaproteobacteria bacterium]|nr:hypothetical protein [Deltaproteobacteria bacterium]